MFKKITSVVMTLGLALSFSAMAELHPDVKKDKYGYVDDAGNVVIKHQFKAALPFENGVARVQKGAKWGYIREDGSYAIPAKYDFIGAYNDEGYCWVASGKTLKDSKKGIYKDDVLIFKPKYTKMGFFVKTDTQDFSNGEPFSFADGPDEMTHNGSKLSSPGDVPYIWVRNATYNLIFDLNGNQCSPSMFWACGAPKDGVFLCQSTVSKDQKIKYNYALAQKKLKELFKSNIVGEVGKPRVAFPFNNGTAVCLTNKGMAIINTKGDIVSSGYKSLGGIGNNLFIANRDDNYGVIDGSGNEKIPFNYSFIKVGKTFVDDNILTVADKSGKWGCIDINGLTIIPLAYDAAAAFSNGYACVKTANGWGLISKDNRTVIKHAWSDIYQINNPDATHTWVKANDGKWYAHSIISDKRGHAIGYDEVGFFDTKGRAYVKKDDKLGMVKADGSVVLPISFTSGDVAVQALAYIDANGIEAMKEVDAYRFNIYQNPDRHKLLLSAPVDNSMWDF